MAVLELVLFGATLLPWFGWNKVANALEHARSYLSESAAPGPKVLVVSVRESDRFGVRATVEPRGYSVLLADSVAAGTQIIGRQRDQIAIVVVDSALPQSNRLLQAARSHCPRAHLFVLNGPRRAGEVSALLINNALN